MTAKKRVQRTAPPPPRGRTYERADALLRGLEDVEPTIDQRCHFTAGFLSGFEHSTSVRIANWLETLAKPDTQPADYYTQAAERIRSGEWR